MTAGTTTDIHGGRKVGKYETLTLLSMGGMAELYLAYTAGPGGFRKFVALKQILPDIKKDESFRKMFLDEARITGAFSHSNIGQVFDLGEEDGELYLAMEFISGQNLEQLWKACRKQGRELPVGFAAMAVRDTCLALHYAHHFVDPSGRPAPVVHRDVSPKNVMVTYDGNVKVIDFGIAKAKGRLNRTQAGMVKGTTSYMSPEQIRNEELDGRSDLFSAGVMLHEFLTGKRLYEGPSDAATMIQIVEEQAASPRSLNPKVPAALDAVVMKALARKRDERFATGKEMAKAIDAAMAGELFDADDAAAFMQELFAEKVKKTRALLEMASRDDRNLSEAAGQLRDEAEATARGTPGPRPAPRTPRPPAAKTPARATPARAQPQKTPPARASGATPPGRRPPARPAPEPEVDDEPTPAKDRWSSKVASDFALYSDQDAETVRKPQAAHASSHPTSVRPQIRRPVAEAPQKSGGLLRVLVWLLVLGGIGGLGFAATREQGPVADLARPHLEKAKAWVAKEFAAEPPPPGDSPIVATAPKGPPPPQALALAQNAAQAQQRATPAVADPAPSAPGPEVVAPPVVEKKEVPAPKPAPKLARAEAPAKVKTASAVKEPAQQPKAPKVAKDPDSGLPVTTVTQTTDEVQVLDTKNARAAEEEGLGWLTLYTVPPTWVYDGATKLGTTPLTKMPLPAGTYRLRVIDPDSKYRTLSAPIRPGKVTELKIRVADLPLDPGQD